VAVTPRLIAESAESAAAKVDAQSGPAPRAFRAPRPARTPHWRKPLIAVLSTAALFVLLLGGAVWISGGAMPGDSLYSLKRASENAQLSLTTDGSSRGKGYLDLATTRAGEITRLLSRTTSGALGSGPQSAAGISSRTADLVTHALEDHDSEVSDGSQLLGTDAVTSRSVAPLDTMTGWAPGQLSRLQAIVERIPAGSLHDRAEQSWQLAERAFARAQQLKGALSLPCLNQSSSDELGPVPPTSCPATITSRPPAGSIAPSRPAAPGSPSPAATTPAMPGSTAQSGPDQLSTTGSRSQSSGATTSSSTLPGGPGSSSTPPVTTTTPPSPITTNSCGLQVSLGPIGVGLGDCGLSIGLGAPN
jgi:uncharacterized membrane protein YgcG